jgi:uncharacterized membrane protein
VWRAFHANFDGILARFDQISLGLETHRQFVLGNVLGALNDVGNAFVTFIFQQGTPMNPAHLHLLLNHFPLAALLFGFVIFIVSQILRNEIILRIALVILVVGGVAGTAAFLTGDPAEDVLKAFPSFSEARVHEHESAATFGLWSTIITACAAVGGLYFSRKNGKVPKGYRIFIFVLNFWALTVIARTNYLGGQISHPEIRSDSTSSNG